MNKTYRPILFVTLAALSLSVHATSGQDEVRSTINEQQSVAVTIYNNNLALIKDQRKVKLSHGINVLALRDVSGQIRSETALLRSLSHPGSFATLEQNFDYDLLTPQKLLEKYVGKTVDIIKTQPITGEERIEPATVLATNNGVVLKINNRIETGVAGRIIYPEVPDNLRDRPTLVTTLNNHISDEQTVELSYLTGGLSWKADYVAELNAKENSMDLSGWVTLANTSGARYNNAKLQLVAGNVNRVQDTRPREMAMRKNMAMLAESTSSMSEESLLEYHLYSLDRPTTIADNQTKQVSLLSAVNIPVRKELVSRGSDYYYQSSYGELGSKVKVGVYVEFDNKESSKLGMPLPKGVIRVYKNDSKQNAQFVGEDEIDHTPTNEVVRLKLGDSFDVTADRKQTDFKVLPKLSKGNSVFESAYEITIKNAKKENVTVTVQEPISGDWKIITENIPHEKANSHLAVWKVEVPANGKSTLTYRAQVLH